MSQLLPIGTRMVREDDGKSGTLELVDEQLRVVFLDRGEHYVAPKSERWHPFEPEQGPLREEEKLQVALAADRYLKSFVLHQACPYWQPIDLGAEPFDQKLVRVIVDYLGTRN